MINTGNIPPLWIVVFFKSYMYINHIGVSKCYVHSDTKALSEPFSTHEAHKYMVCQQGWLFNWA